MKRNVQRKLRSNEGASLTFAILLFLVCAVIGSIVLTAGTIASGRLAEKAEMDKRYYNVISTAEFFKDTLDGKKVVIIREKRDKVVIKVEGYEGSVKAKSEDYFEDETNFQKYDFLTLRTLELLPEYSWDADFYDDSSEDDKTNEFEFQVQGQELASTIKTIVKNGVMLVDISDSGYTVRMTFSPHVYEITTEEDGIEVKKATITWHVDNIEKVFGKDE